LTAPQQQPPPGFSVFGLESDLSFAFSRRFAFLGGFSEHLLRLSLALRFLIGRRQYDAVVSGRYGEFYGLLQSLLGFGRRPYLLLDIEWYSMPSRSWRNRLNLWLHRRIVQGASRIQVFCHAEARSYAAYFGVDEAKFIWIPYCTGTSARPHPPAPGEYLFTSGTHQRDYKTLLAAVAGLPLKLHIAAPSSAFDGLIVPPNVVILGTLPPEEYNEVLLRSRFVVVSLDPHVPRRPGVITYVSAMQAGKCVVVNDPMGAASYIEHNRTGFLVPAADPAGLRNQILALWHDPDKIQAVGLEAQHAAQQRFSAGCYYPLIQTALQEVLRAER